MKYEKAAKKAKAIVDKENSEASDNKSQGYEENSEEDSDPPIDWFVVDFEGVEYKVNPSDNLALNLTKPHLCKQMGYWDPDKEIIDLFDDEEEEIHENNKE